MKTKHFAVWVEPDETTMESMEKFRLRIGVIQIEGTHCLTRNIGGPKRKLGIKCISAMAPEKAVRKYVRGCLPAILFLHENEDKGIVDWTGTPSGARNQQEKSVKDLMSFDGLGRYCYVVYEAAM